jgi:hypothetical protein
MKVGKLTAAECSGSSLPDQQSLAQRDVGNVGSSSSTTNECAETRNVTHQQKPSRSYAEVATSATSHVSAPAKESAEEEFIVVSRKRDRAPNRVAIANAVPHKKLRTPLTGVRNASALTVIAKKAETMFLFVSRFSPDVTAQDIKSSFEEQLIVLLDLH